MSRRYTEISQAVFVIHSSLLQKLDWLDHGFGTRHAPLSQDGMAALKQIHSSVSLVADRPTGWVGDVARQFGITGSGHIDWAAANRRQLIDAGVPESQIDVLGLCTRCDPERFHSYRRDKDSAGRMISYVRIQRL